MSLLVCMPLRDQDLTGRTPSAAATSLAAVENEG